MKCIESFGFLKYSKSLDFEGGSIVPTDEYERNLGFVDDNANRDGYFYPPSTNTVELDINTMKPIKAVPNSTRPAAVFCLPVSHDLYISDPISERNLRFEDAGFLIHKLGFFFGTRLQFKDWRFDGKVPIAVNNSFTYSDDISAHYLSHAYQTWRAWNDDLRKRYVNILYMFGRSMSCEWEWDAFIYQYMVFDAIYRWHMLLGNKEISGHKKRLSGLCDFYHIAYMSEAIERIYHLRNNLFHEALWDGSTPGYSLGEAYLSEKWLRRLNSRLIVSLIGYKNDFSRSEWSHFGWQLFDKYE